MGGLGGDIWEYSWRVFGGKSDGCLGVIYPVKNMYNILYFDYGKEIIDTAETFKEAKYLLKEYKMAFQSNNLKISKA